MATESIHIDRIRIDGGTQPRARLDQQTIDDYAEAISDGQELPPVDVFFDDSDYWLADGFHRYHAHRKAEFGHIDCNVHKGTQRDAILFSVGANRGHGLRRTNEDKRRAVQKLLDDADWSNWTDRVIADRCGVSHTLVAELRPQLATDANSTRTGRDGKEYPATKPAKPETKRESQVYAIDLNTGEITNAAVQRVTTTTTAPAQDQGLLLSLQQVNDCIDGLAAFEPSRDAVPLLGRAIKGLTELARRCERAT